MYNYLVLLTLLWLEIVTALLVAMEMLCTFTHLEKIISDGVVIKQVAN